MPSVATIGPTLPASQGGAAAAAAVSATKTAQKERTTVRRAAGKVWSDPTLDEWAADDFRLFCGDLGNEVTDDLLANAFRKYKSFQRAKIIRDKRSGRTKGYGFASFANPEDMIQALREVNGKYVGNRPIRLKKSAWKDRNIDSEKNAKIPDLQYAIKTDSTSLKKFKKINMKKKQKDEKKNKKGA